MPSPLEQMRARMQETREADHLDVVVPGPNYDGRVFVRYARLVPADDAIVIARKGDKGSQVQAQVEFLVDSTVAVFARVDGVEHGFNMAGSTDSSEWPKFDSSLAEMLPEGLEPRAVSIARGFFAAGFDTADRMILSEGSIIDHARQVAAFYRPGAEGK